MLYAWLVSAIIGVMTFPQAVNRQLRLANLYWLHGAVSLAIILAFRGRSAKHSKN